MLFPFEESRAAAAAAVAVATSTWHHFVWRRGSLGFFVEEQLRRPGYKHIYFVLSLLPVIVAAV